ncbi:MAG: geranylgeranyl reductase family protein [Candidatus Hermodarchaeota archaeon]
MTKDSFDIVIVGSGSAGAVTAFKLCKKGFQVALIERKEKNTIGKKICGDAMDEKAFDTSGIPKPAGEERKQLVKGLDLYSPSMKTKIRIETDDYRGYIIDRHLFGQRLLKLALDAGAQLFEKRHVTGIIHNKNQILGIKAKVLDNRKNEEFKGKLVVDASGSSAVIRRKLSPELAGFIEPKISKEDTYFGYREIRNVQQPLDDPEYLKIYLNQEYAPKGYIWVFPREEGNQYSANVGLGGAAGYNFDFRAQFEKYIQENPLFINSEVLDQGSGYVPRRRAIDSLVTDGLVLAGDAACQVNPLHAGGLSPSLEVGDMITKTFEQALEQGDFTAKSLWSYNVQYQRTIGVRYSSHDMVKIVLNEATNKELDFILDKKIISQKDLADIGVIGAEFRISSIDKIKRGLKLVRKPSLLFRLNKTSKLMNEIRDHYITYPEDINQFVDWEKKLRRRYYPMT